MSNNIIYFYCMLGNNGFIHACELNILKWSGEQLPTTCIYYLLFTFGCSCKCESARSDFIGAWEELASKPQISWARPLRRRLFHAGHYVDLMVRKQNWRFLFSLNNKTGSMAHCSNLGFQTNYCHYCTLGQISLKFFQALGWKFDLVKNSIII